MSNGSTKPPRVIALAPVVEKATMEERNHLAGKLEDFARLLRDSKKNPEGFIFIGIESFKQKDTLAGGNVPVEVLSTQAALVEPSAFAPLTLATFHKVLNTVMGELVNAYQSQQENGDGNVH